MKFALPAVLAATCIAPAVAEVFFKEQFNDDVSDVIGPTACEGFGHFLASNAKFPFKNVPVSTSVKI